ncbi:MAG TPA: hypothetical protein VGD46_14760 [Rhizobacter sp.]
MRKFLGGLFLAVLLLLTQQGAVVHELSHWPAQASQGDGGHEHPGAAQLCAACLAFSHLGSSAMAGAAAAALLAGLAFAAPPGSTATAASLLALAPRSRGPPSRL